MAATSIGGKAIETGDDLLYANLLQVRDELVKLVDVLFGNKEVAARPHLSLAGKLDRAQALAVRAFAKHGPVVNLTGTVEGKPQRGRSQGEQGL